MSIWSRTLKKNLLKNDDILKPANVAPVYIAEESVIVPAFMEFFW